MLSSFHEIHVCLERGEVALFIFPKQSKANVHDIRVQTKKNIFPLIVCILVVKYSMGNFWIRKKLQVKAALNLFVP